MACCRFYIGLSKTLIFLVLLFLTRINSSDMCPSVCDCGTLGASRYTECHDVNFTALPNDIPLDTNLLFLSNTKITSFSTNAFSRLSHLIKIELSHNRIENITDGVFSGLTNLKTLNLPNNRIRRISSDAFAGLSSLTKLTLSNNDLTSLPQDMLRDQANLKTLNLDNNQLKILPSGFLNSTVGLTSLHLNKNEIQSIEDKAFAPAGNTLFMVNLENNRLPSFPRALYDIKSVFIMQISLGSNLITTIPKQAEPLFQQVKNSGGKISLSGNPLVCTSGLQWMQTWTKQNEQTIKDLDQVMCVSMDGKTMKFMDYDFNSTVSLETTVPTTTRKSTSAAPSTSTKTTTTTTTTTTRPSTHTTTRTTAKLQTSTSTQSTTTTPTATTTTTTATTSKQDSEYSFTSTSRVTSTTETMTSTTEVKTRISPNVTSTQEMPASGSASSANITHNIFTKPTPKTDEADMKALERNKHIILATCLSAAFIALVVFVSMYCFRDKIVKRDKVLSTRYDRVRIV